MRKFDHAIERRAKKEPVAYILGKKEFWSIDFPINKSTLIPRPETELLVREVVKFKENKNVNVLDIGTGCGCILLSILKEFHNSKGTGIDICEDAIQVAKKNAKRLNLANRTLFETKDLNHFYEGEYDLVVSNPPYVPSAHIKKLSKEITEYEPLRALNGGIDGLDLIKKVIYKSKILLKKNGILAIEIGYNQYKKVSDILTKNGFREASKVCDNGFNVRCIVSTK